MINQRSQGGYLCCLGLFIVKFAIVAKATGRAQRWTSAPGGWDDF